MCAHVCMLSISFLRQHNNFPWFDLFLLSVLSSKLCPSFFVLINIKFLIVFWTHYVVFLFHILNTCFTFFCIVPTSLAKLRMIIFFFNSVYWTSKLDCLSSMHPLPYEYQYHDVYYSIYKLSMFHVNVYPTNKVQWKKLQLIYLWICNVPSSARYAVPVCYMEFEPLK